MRAFDTKVMAVLTSGTSERMSVGWKRFRVISTSIVTRVHSGAVLMREFEFCCSHLGVRVLLFSRGSSSSAFLTRQFQFCSHEGVRVQLFQRGGSSSAVPTKEFEFCWKSRKPNSGIPSASTLNMNVL